MTFFAELGLLGNTVGLIIMGVLFLFTLLGADAFNRDGAEPEEALFFVVPINVLFGVGLLYFATRFVKAVWEL